MSSVFVFERSRSSVIGAFGPIGEEQADKIVDALTKAGREAFKDASSFGSIVLSRLVPRIDLRSVNITIDVPTKNEYPKVRTATMADGLWIHLGELARAFKFDGSLTRQIGTAFAKDVRESLCKCPSCTESALTTSCLYGIALATGLSASDLINAAEQPTKTVEETSQSAMPELEKQLAEGEPAATS